MASSTASRKAKGRRLQDWVRDLLRVLLQMDEDDISSAIMGTSGEDIILTKRARKFFPFSVECKNQEKLNLYGAYAQATSNANLGEPLLIIKKNNHKPLAVVDAEYLIRLYDRSLHD